jgi:multidrug efflux pump subunit AcrA (membrane-fusion protein)
MKTFITALVTATCAAAMVWMYRDASRPQPTVAPSPVSVPVVQMPVPAKPRQETGTEIESRLEPSSEVEVRTPLVDYLIHVKVNSGDFVQKGQIVVDLGDSKLEESVRQAEAALNVVKTEFQARQARLAQPVKDPTSLVAIAPPTPAAGTRRGMPAPQNPGQSAEDDLDKTRLQQAEAGVARAKAALAETRIAAPIDGYVTQRIADGELSKPDVVLLRIVDISSVHALVQPSPEITSKIVTDQEARVVLTEMPGRTFVGKVVRNSAAGRLRAREAGVMVEIPNPEAVLKPGMYAHVRLMFDQNNEPRLASFAAWSGKSAHGRGPDGKAAGPQSDSELLTNLKGLTQSMSTMASELEHRELAAKVTGEASREHFFALEKLVVRLRDDSASSRKSSFEKTAEAIDNLPALHVDEELLAFSTDVARALREMAENRRAIGRNAAGVDWTYWDVTQRAAGAVKSQGLQRINSAMTEMRRKLTRKYNLEFLLTAERAQTSHRATNRSRP